MLAANFIKIDGKRFKPGDEIVGLKDEQIERLKAAGALVTETGAIPAGANEGTSDARAAALDAREADLAKREAALQSRELVAAAQAMLIEDPEKKIDGFWLKDGRPEAKELAKRVGREVTAAERDAAFPAA